MSNEVVHTNQKVDVWRKPEKIRQLFAPTLTEDEFMFFMGLGRSMNANPFKREIWAIKYSKSAPASIFLARDFYRKVAQSQPDYKVHRSFAVYENDNFKIKNGIPDHEFVLKNRGKLIGAYAELVKKEIDQSFVVYVEFSEYNSGQSNWKKMPATMISKVAEAQVLRMSYQDLFSGTHSEDEQSTIENNYQQLENQYQQEPPTLDKAETFEAETQPEKQADQNLFNQDKKKDKNYAELIEQFLLAEYPNPHDAGNFLEEFTGFETKDKNTGEPVKIKGKRTVAELSLARQKVTWQKIEKL